MEHREKQEAHVSPYERLRREFPGSSLGGPKVQVQIYIRRAWASLKDNVEGLTARLIEISLKKNLDTFSESELMEIVDILKALESRQRVKNSLQLPIDNGLDERQAAE